MSWSEILILLSVGAITAPLTFHIHLNWKQGPVRASAGVSLVVGLLCYLLSQSYYHGLLEQIPMVVMGASFVGMVSFRVMKRYMLLALAGLLSSTFFVLESSLFQGFGGLLGASANIAILVVLGGVIVYRKLLHRSSNDQTTG